MAGAGESWFLGKAKEGVYKNITNRAIKTIPFSPGTVEEYYSKCSESNSRQLLFNSVKQCLTCGKPCAVSLSFCNRCNSNLENVKSTETPNLFTAFMLGIESSGTFTLKISIRDETNSLLVFDDPLALSPAHFCAIPTLNFIPDWRYLIYKPKIGLDLINSLVNACHKVFKEQFLKDPKWKNTLLGNKDLDIEKHILIGFNYPPSQNQLHVQYIVPPLMPQHFFMFCRGQHFTYNRFFPLSYVSECLNKLLNNVELLDPYHSFLNLSIDDFIKTLDKKCDTSYKKEHNIFISRVQELQNYFGNWKNNNFEGIYKLLDNNKGKLLFNPLSGESCIIDEHVAFAEDKKILQNYGRPYDENGKPGGGFYSFAKSIEDISIWS